MVLSRVLPVFALRWVINSLGMWLVITLFGALTEPAGLTLYLTAGLVFSLVNIVVKPLLTLLSLPFILVTMGLFTLIVNALMIALTIAILPTVEMDFLETVLSALTLAFVNYLVNYLVPVYNER
jgi:putative membrane protein